ncbi:hypothetical protein BC828DRAFT_409101 [Blastocladiella britannica]|nr:hypothetical protein BC828DRAFT_409101 [Blastocladiella britannica]
MNNNNDDSKQGTTGLVQLPDAALRKVATFLTLSEVATLSTTCQHLHRALLRALYETPTLPTDRALVLLVRTLTQDVLLDDLKPDTLRVVAEPPAPAPACKYIVHLRRVRLGHLPPTTRVYVHVERLARIIERARHMVPKLLDEIDDSLDAENIAREWDFGVGSLSTLRLLPASTLQIIAASVGPNLQTLRVPSQPQLNDNAYLAVTHYCPRLRVLHAPDAGVTPTAVRAFAARCHALETVDVSGSPRLDADDLRELVRACPKLVSVRAERCWRAASINPAELVVAMAAHGNQVNDDSVKVSRIENRPDDWQVPQRRVPIAAYHQDRVPGGGGGGSGGGGSDVDWEDQEGGDDDDDDDYEDDDDEDPYALPVFYARETDDDDDEQDDEGELMNDPDMDNEDRVQMELLRILNDPEVRPGRFATREDWEHEVRARVAQLAPPWINEEDALTDGEFVDQVLPAEEMPAIWQALSNPRGLSGAMRDWLLGTTDDNEDEEDDEEDDS